MWNELLDRQQGLCRICFRSYYDVSDSFILVDISTPIRIELKNDYGNKNESGSWLPGSPAKALYNRHSEFSAQTLVCLCVFATTAMASNSTENVLCELAKLVGVEAICVRKTDESPPRVSVIDVAVVVTGHDAHYASEAVHNIRKKFPDIHDKIGDAFLDARGRRGQHQTIAKPSVQHLPQNPCRN